MPRVQLNVQSIRKAVDYAPMRRLYMLGLLRNKRGRLRAGIYSILPKGQREIGDTLEIER